MKNIQKLGAYLPETYQYFPIFTDIFTYNDTAFDTWKIQCKLPPKTKRFCPLVLK